jgi:hypothetical protein
MSVLVVRHGLSAANDRSLAAFGKSDAPLLQLGIEQSKNAGRTLSESYGVDPDKDQAAASLMLRSQESAHYAGFTVVSNYAVLNEVDVPKTPALRAVIDRGIIISEAREAAKAVLTNPPAERIWFTHGYLIAALCDLTEVDTSGLRFIPRFGEIRELPISLTQQ